MIYTDMEVWKKAMDLSEEIYYLTKKFPREELFSLVDQMRRSSVSIASNIAEGQSRISSKDYLHFLSMARGSKAELHTQLLLAQRFGYVTEKDASKAIQLIDVTGKLLNGTIRGIRSKIAADADKH